MEEQNTDVLIPAIQDTIQFQKKPLVVVRLPDGQLGVVLRWMCENVDLDTQVQVRCRFSRLHALFNLINFPGVVLHRPVRRF